MYGLNSRSFGKLINAYGYQGKELQNTEFADGTGLEEYDFEARYYDPQLGRWHNPDPAGQFASPYLAMGNNWISNSNPDGRFVWFIPLIIGALAGGIEGHQIGLANGATGWGMAGYIFGGAAIGAASGYVGGEFAAGGGAFANTSALMSGSFMNSMGMNALSGGRTDVSISFGIGSFDISSGELGYIGKKNNTFLDNFAYGLGAMANIQDILTGFHPGKAYLQFENDPAEGSPGYAKGKDLIGHTQVLNDDKNSLIDFGPKEGGTASFFKFSAGRNDWTCYSTDESVAQMAQKPTNLFKTSIPVNGINTNTLSNISSRLNQTAGQYNFLLRSCSSVASRALFMSGKFLIGGIYPNFLRLSAILNEAGVRPSIFSYYLTDKY